MPRQQQRHTPQQPRFILKWVNSTWVIFDRVRFINCETFGTRKEAERVLNG